VSRCYYKLGLATWSQFEKCALARQDKNMLLYLPRITPPKSLRIPITVLKQYKLTTAVPTLLYAAYVPSSRSMAAGFETLTETSDWARHVLLRGRVYKCALGVHRNTSKRGLGHRTGSRCQRRIHIRPCLPTSKVHELVHKVMMCSLRPAPLRLS
jgi:hypothetical protein